MREATSEAGATAVEYSLFAGLVAAVIVLAVAAVGDQVVLLFQSVTSGMGWS